MSSGEVGIGWCCCGCPNWSDDFNRADSTDLGSNWEEIAGDPDDQDIYSNTLRQLHAGNRAKWDHALPRSWMMKIRIIDVHYGDIFHVLVDWQEDGGDPSNYHYVELEIGASLNEDNYLRLRRCDGGAHSTLILVDANGHTTNAERVIGQAAQGQNHNFSICLSSPDDVHWIWNVDYPYDPIPDTRIWTCEPPYHTVGTRRIVLENGADQAIRWDDFFLTRHRADLLECPDCVCSCSGFCISRELVATMSNIAGAPRLDGWEIPLHFRALTYDLPPAAQWMPDEYPDDTPPVDERFYGIDLIFAPGEHLHEDTEFTCDGTFAAPDFGLSIWTLYQATIVSIQCNPLVVVFEYDFYSGSEPACGLRMFTIDDEPADPPTVRRHFYVTVTE